MNNHHLSLLMHELRLRQSYYSSNIFGTFVSSEMSHNFEMCFFGFFLESYFLIEYKFACLILTDLWSQCLASILKFHLARKLNFHFDWLNIDNIWVNLHLFFSLHWIFNLIKNLLFQIGYNKNKIVNNRKNINDFSSDLKLKLRAYPLFQIICYLCFHFVIYVFFC